MCMNFVCMYVCTACMPGAHGGQKKVLELELLTDSCVLSRGGWETTRSSGKAASP